MNIDGLSIGDAKKLLAEAEELRKLFGGQAQSAGSAGRWQTGRNYFIRTVTHHLLGKLEEVTEQELWLSSVSWIADDGRFNEFLATGKPGQAAEIEPAPEGDVAVGRGSLIDAYIWPHGLLREVK